MERLLLFFIGLNLLIILSNSHISIYQELVKDEVPSVPLKSHLKDAKLFPGESWSSGYISIRNDEELYFILFRSRDGNSDAPLGIYLEGGPGGASEYAVFASLGPYIYNATTAEFEENPYSWNNHADLLFVDQPLGTGFSFAKHTDNMCKDRECYAKDFYYFLLNFITQYQEYEQRPIYTFGISYGGHYGPVIYDYILKQEDSLINLQGLGIGSGLVDPLIQTGSFSKYAYSRDLIKWYTWITNRSIFGISQFFNLIRLYLPSFYVYAFGIEQIFGKKGAPPLININATKEWEIYQAKEGLFLLQYLNTEEVQDQLATKHGNLTFQNATVNEELRKDYMKNCIEEMGNVLDSKIPILMFYGNDDFVCNWIGGYQVSKKVKWQNRKQYRKQDLKDFIFNNQTMGVMQQYGILSFINVFNAGHGTFAYQPEFTYNFINQFMNNSL